MSLSTERMIMTNTITVAQIKLIPQDKVDVLAVIRDYVNDHKTKHRDRVEAARYFFQLKKVVLDSDLYSNVLFQFLHGGY